MTLLTGGARAGKSALAARLAEETSLPVVFVATAQALDDEMAERIERHRAERVAGWTTVEEPLDLRRALAGVDPGAATIVDCLTLWVSNLLLEGRDEGDIAARAEGVAALCEGRAAPVFVVTNEVGDGVVPTSELGRQFRDVLGRVNTIFAGEATKAFLVVAGRRIALERWR